PEVRSRTELLFAIAQHDVSARPRQGLRTARKLLGSIVESLPLLGSRSAGVQRPPPAPQPVAAASQLTESTEPSRLQLRREAGQLELSWQVNPRDAQRARRLLGQDGELSLRIVCVQADPQQVVRSSVTEHGPLEAEGVWSWTLPGPDTHCVGSVGVRFGDQFVSIAHESSRVPISAS
ncbi:MAG TPA: hypothetical protein VMF89_15590, partial [Polyangiales bacterium]|nr:hypothetical protein [Polyangiales bacterium]